MIEPQVMLDWLDKRIHSAEIWLSDFSEGKRKRPDMEIAQKQTDIVHFQEIRGAYLKALARKQSAEQS